MLIAVLSRTINEVATSAEREQWVNDCSVAVASIHVPPGRRLACRQLAALALGCANGWAIGPNAGLYLTRSPLPRYPFPRATFGSLDARRTCPRALQTARPSARMRDSIHQLLPRSLLLFIRFVFRSAETGFIFIHAVSSLRGCMANFR